MTSASSLAEAMDGRALHILVPDPTHSHLVPNEAMFTLLQELGDDDLDDIEHFMTWLSPKLLVRMNADGTRSTLLSCGSPGNPPRPASLRLRFVDPDHGGQVALGPCTFAACLVAVKW